MATVARTAPASSTGANSRLSVAAVGPLGTAGSADVPAAPRCRYRDTAVTTMPTTAPPKAIQTPIVPRAAFSNGCAALSLDGHSHLTGTVTWRAQSFGGHSHLADWVM